MAEWELGGLAHLSDAALARAVTAHFQAIYRAVFAGEQCVNHALGFEVRAPRRMDEGWRVFLLLTPWMLSRVLLPEHDPQLSLPDEWSADARAAAPYAVIGPRVSLSLLGRGQQAHINYDMVLGHYLIQPLVQSMRGYASTEAVFAAWNEVIAARMRTMDEQRRDCLWQGELSRREFLTRFSSPRG